MAADIASRAIARASLAEQVRARHGAPNALVNNAGRAPRVRADILEASEESFEELMRTNLQGPYFLTQELSRDMVARREADPSFRASIVFVTSVSAEMASTEPRRVLRQQGRAGDGGEALRRAARGRVASRSTKCDPASSPRT